MSKDKVTNILIAGVGGQGALLASDVISMVAMESGLDVKKSEVHGMAQRGGSVVSHVRFGSKVYSPLIRRGEADYIVAFEKLEALRYVDFLKKDGVVVMNDQEIVPMTVYSGNLAYPADIEDRIKGFTKKLVVVDALKIAKELGNKNVVNVVMLGALSKLLDFSQERWEKILMENIPQRFLEVNMKAFAMGSSQNPGV